MIDARRSRVFWIAPIGQRHDMSGLGGFTFGNVATNPVINFALATLPAFATGDETNVRDFAWICAHGFRLLSLNAHRTKGVVLAAAPKYFDFVAAACIPRRSFARDALLNEGRGYRPS